MSQSNYVHLDDCEVIALTDASMSIGFVHGADTSDSTPDLNPR